MNAKKYKLIFASATAAILSAVFVTVLTIWAELSEPLKEWLKSLTGHHWVSKSWGVVIIYLAGLAVIYWLGPREPERLVGKSLKALIAAVIVGTLAIFLFFVWHYYSA